jgi:hypothetical protein
LRAQIRESSRVDARKNQKPETKTTETKPDMKKLSTSKKLLAGAAIAGLLSGGLSAQLNAASTATTTAKSGAPTAGVLADEKKGETHDCAGKNSCKGKGGCKSGDNGCAGKNSCKGKGGCAMKDGKPVKAH